MNTTETARQTEQSGQPAKSCCGGPASAGTSACCIKDAEAKAKGQSGCGCGCSSKSV